ncbi:hypothetical protein [Cupriavidus basilensis]|uniref:hypothetical protein n=1 Tax=Cupriavidus basilensis TaxID=68895 RepID=UPI00157B39B9|nr:hypothetical protein [Cupriavidus basilensis]NUA26317.1 hypothetical protein [Cupriavidus basilensis]
MPIVFVHGVNNRREEPDFDQGVQRNNGFLRDILANQIGLDPAKLSTFFPYWGGHGVKFRWKQASLPSGSDAVESLSLDKVGPGSGDYEMWIGEARYQYGPGEVSFGQISRARGFEEAVDLIWDTASAVVKPETGYADVTDAYNASLAYAKANPAPQWAMQTPSLSNEAFVSKLVQEIQPELDAKAGEPHESLGLKDWLQSLKEAASRLDSAPMDAASAALVGVGRKSIHEITSRFLGDIFVYLSERGTKDAPGPIVQDVVADLDKAVAAKQPGDDKLVVIGHSLGGVILYDILTYFRPDLKFDVFATIGSQVALFEEMTLYRASDAMKPANPPMDLLDQPTAMGKWLNVFDTNDVFSFKAGTVFKGPTDFKFDTGYGLLQAHGGYFARPSFYKRLGVRLS